MTTPVLPSNTHTVCYHLPMTPTSRAHAPVPVSPKNPLLDYAQVAELLTTLREGPTTDATVRHYKRTGKLPVPDLQVGGTFPTKGTKVGGTAYLRDPLPADPARPWTEPEKIDARYFWLRSTIVAWNKERPGPGRWRGSRATGVGEKLTTKPRKGGG